MGSFPTVTVPSPPVCLLSLISSRLYGFGELSGSLCSWLTGALDDVGAFVSAIVLWIGTSLVKEKGSCESLPLVTSCPGPAHGPWSCFHGRKAVAGCCLAPEYVCPVCGHSKTSPFPPKGWLFLSSCTLSDWSPSVWWRDVRGHKKCSSASWESKWFFNNSLINEGT